MGRDGMGWDFFMIHFLLFLSFILFPDVET